MLDVVGREIVKGFFFHLKRTRSLNQNQAVNYYSFGIALCKRGPFFNKLIYCFSPEIFKSGAKKLIQLGFRTYYTVEYSDMHLLCE